MRIQKKLKKQNKKQIISLFDVDGMELQKMFREFDEAMEYRKDHHSITHPQIRLVRT